MAIEHQAEQQIEQQIKQGDKGNRRCYEYLTATSDGERWEALQHLVGYLSFVMHKKKLFLPGDREGLQADLHETGGNKPVARDREGDSTKWFIEATVIEWLASWRLKPIEEIREQARMGYFQTIVTAVTNKLIDQLRHESTDEIGHILMEKDEDGEMVPTQPTIESLNVNVEAFEDEPHRERRIDQLAAQGHNIEADLRPGQIRKGNRQNGPNPGGSPLSSKNDVNERIWYFLHDTPLLDKRICAGIIKEPIRAIVRTRPIAIEVAERIAEADSVAPTITRITDKDYYAPTWFVTGSAPSDAPDWYKEECQWHPPRRTYYIRALRRWDHESAKIIDQPSVLYTDPGVLPVSGRQLRGFKVRKLQPPPSKLERKSTPEEIAAWLAAQHEHWHRWKSDIPSEPTYQPVRLFYSEGYTSLCKRHAAFLVLCNGNALFDQTAERVDCPSQNPDKSAQFSLDHDFFERDHRPCCGFHFEEDNRRNYGMGVQPDDPPYWRIVDEEPLLSQSAPYYLCWRIDDRLDHYFHKGMTYHSAALKVLDRRLYDSPEHPYSVIHPCDCGGCAPLGTMLVQDRNWEEKHHVYRPARQHHAYATYLEFCTSVGILPPSYYSVGVPCLEILWWPLSDRIYPVPVAVC